MKRTQAYRNHVFVVEMWVETSMRKGYWGPTAGISLTLGDSAPAIRQWRLKNPTDKFRVTKYVRSKP